MADLHAKLEKRRKGILGNKDSATPNVMDKVSAMIPQPPKPMTINSATETSEDEGEWAADEEWE